MVRWEYRVIDISKVEDLEDRLDSLGDYGWELVAVTNTRGDKIIMKRPMY